MAEADTEMRQRLLPKDNEDENNGTENLPLSAKIKLARKAHKDPLYVRVLEVSSILTTIEIKSRGPNESANHQQTHQKKSIYGMLKVKVLSFIV